ncbi:MAG: hypothetical protein VKI81_10490, partial [Synechococcaceae cyanobacterium]|nr:hypothetical protein [Synechococcaceae cyanobacterium]
YLDVRPERAALLRRMVGEGRLAIGPWYVLADELLAGDEPLVRNLLMGRHRAAALGGWLAVGYSPDAFGHPEALPAILRGFGIETAVLWRGYGGRPGEDRDLFTWAAPDGSTVLTHHLPPAGYEYGAELPAGRRDAGARWQVLAAVLVPRAVVPVLLVMNGADHHGLQPDLRKALRALRAVSPDTDVTIGTLDDYFAAVRAALGRADAPAPRRVSGELRWSYGHTWTLQGVAATRTALKQVVAEGAALLTRWAEPQAALAVGMRDWRAGLALAWRVHLTNLTHDVLAGCVSDDVADDVQARARQVVGQARGTLTDALDARLGQDPVRRRRERANRVPSLVLVNPSPRTRGGVVEATLTVARQPVVVGRPAPSVPPAPFEPVHVVTATGVTVPMQVLGVTDAYERIDSPRDYPESTRVWAVRVAVLSDGVPPFGLTRLDVRAGTGGRPSVADPVRASASGVTASWGQAVVTT